MGLAMTYGIVKQHGGYIECESVVGEGYRYSESTCRYRTRTRNTKAPVKNRLFRRCGDHFVGR